MATKPKRIKAPALNCPQSRDDAAQWVAELGTLGREIGHHEAVMNEKISACTAEHQPTITALREKYQETLKGLQAWAEANRGTLTDGDAKTVNLITGEIGWRKVRAHIVVKDVAAVIAELIKRRLKQFVRTKHELDKNAILANPGKFEAIEGISIITDKEEFFCKPFEQGAA